MAGRSFDTQNLEIGGIFEDKYRIVEEIGRGGFGMVYLAHQEAMDRSVALKVLKTGLPPGDAAQAKERFLREVKVIASLRHPNTITIHDFGESREGVLYMVLEFIEGDTLDEILENQGAQPPERALHFGMQIARSLAEAHRHGVVHRDLKPANIMVTELETEGEFVKVLDFGVARLLQNEQKDLTQAGMPDDEQQVIGTPRYMSPEQVRGDEVDGRTDVYCLGLLIYEMLVGVPAVQGETPMALITQHINPEPLPLDQLRALPDGVGQIVRKCTAQDKPDRYESAELLVQDLRQITSVIGKGAGSGASSSMSDSFSGASMSYEGELVTDYQDELSDMQHQSAWNDSSGDELSTEDWEPGAPNSSAHGTGAAGGTPPEIDQQAAGEFGEADPFSPTKPKSQHADDMPAPPDDDDAFVPESDQSADRASRSDVNTGSMRHQSGDTRGEIDSDPMLQFTLDTFKIVLLTATAGIGVYITFLLLGALLDGLLAGQTRVMASLIIALFFPVLSAIGETSDRERFRVVRRRINRMARALITTAGLTFASSALILLTVPERAIGQLRADPNWFLTENNSQLASINEDFSRTLADLFAGATSAVGVYEPGAGESSSPSPVPTEEPTEPPPPTRPSTASGGDEGAPSDSDDESDDRQPRSAIELLEQESDDESSDDQEESDEEQPSRTDDDDYQNW